jgi:DNA-binding NarL/FixJ family response regulator
MDKIRLLIADDHPTFRSGLARILEDEEDIECIATAADGTEAVRLVTEMQPDVALIDVCMPNLNGIEATRRIREDCHDTAILIMSAFDCESYVLAALQAGAAGYMMKDTPLNELVSAIRLVRRGDSVLDVKATDKLVHYLRVGSGDDGSGTSSGVLHYRELEVLKLTTRGLSNKDIAAELVISERTVQTHLFNIYRKLGVDSRTQAVLYALREGWITLDTL